MSVTKRELRNKEIATTTTQNRAQWQQEDFVSYISMVDNLMPSSRGGETQGTTDCRVQTQHVRSTYYARRFFGRIWNVD